MCFPERLWSGRGGGGGGRPESLREFKERRIREEIIAEEAERRRVLEAEVRRELLIEREMMAMQSRQGYASSFMLEPPHRQHDRFQPEVLQGEIGGLEVVPFPPPPQITTSRPKVGGKGFIGLVSIVILSPYVFMHH